MAYKISNHNNHCTQQTTRILIAIRCSGNGIFNLQNMSGKDLLSTNIKFQCLKKTNVEKKSASL